MDIWTVSQCSPITNKVVRAFAYESLCGYTLLFIWGNDLWVQWLDPIAGECWSFKETARLSSTMIRPFMFSPPASLLSGGTRVPRPPSDDIQNGVSYCPLVALEVLALHRVSTDQRRGACALFQRGRSCLPTWPSLSYHEKEGSSSEPPKERRGPHAPWVGVVGVGPQYFPVVFAWSQVVIVYRFLPGGAASLLALQLERTHFHWGHFGL